MLEQAKNYYIIVALSIYKMLEQAKNYYIIVTFIGLIEDLFFHRFNKSLINKFNLVFYTH